MNTNALPTTFSPALPLVMHIDLNSCFASVEQQANPKLRGKPIAVAAYVTPRGCILAPSIEAKRFGVKTGMRVFEGKKLCPELLVLPSDPPKYRYINQQFKALFSEYTDSVRVLSIDEMVLRFSHAAILQKRMAAANFLGNESHYDKAKHVLCQIACEIKGRIKKEIGEWLLVSIGIAPNGYLAKIAACLHKPDGLDVIDQYSIEETLRNMALTDLTGIKEGYGKMLYRYGICSPIGLYQAPHKTLVAAFHSIIGIQWYLRIKGYEVDDVARPTRSIGHSLALGKSLSSQDPSLLPIVIQLTEKIGDRLRKGGYRASHVHVATSFASGNYWHHGQKIGRAIYGNDEIYWHAKKILASCPEEQVRIIAITVSGLTEDLYMQQTFDPGEKKREKVMQAIDSIHARYGPAFVRSARSLKAPQYVLDRIAFGSTSSVEETEFEDYKQQWS